MNNFTFEAKQKTFLGSLIGVGLICMIATFFVDADRFWSNYLHNAVFFTGVAVMTLFFVAASVTAWGGWYTVFKRLWESMYSFLFVGFALVVVLVLAVDFDLAHLYHWSDPAEVAKDPLLMHKSSFLNKNWYTIASILIVGIWCFFAFKLRSLSLAEDNATNDGAYAYHKKIRIWAAAFLPIAGFSSAAVIWQWVMSVDSHWYSTLYAWYAGASWFVGAMSLTVLLLTYLISKGYFKNVTGEHIHDLGKLVFAFSIFWTYLWFSQFMLIWYSNNGEETIYFNTRMDQYPVLFYANLLINFVLPFFILMRNDTKRKRGTIITASLFVFLGHWLDYFLMIKPGVAHTLHLHDWTMGYNLPGFLEIGTMLGFLGLFIFVVFSRLSKVPIEPKNDPYLAESEHHHVGYGGGPMFEHGEHH